MAFDNSALVNELLKRFVENPQLATSFSTEIEIWEVSVTHGLRMRLLLIEAEDAVFHLRSSCLVSDDETNLMSFPIHGSTDDNSPDEDWLCFLTLVSHDELGWNWCDGGHHHLFIEREALKQANFDADAS